MPTTVVRSCCYEPETAGLIIVFRNGRSYTNQDVSHAIVSAMKSAPSRGVHFNRHIRGNFAFVRNAAGEWLSQPAADGSASVTSYPIAVRDHSLLHSSVESRGQL